MSGAPTPSLLGVTVHRSFVLGRLFLGYGIVIAAFLGVSLSLAKGSAGFQAYPYILPIFGGIGGMGGLMVFASDRMKGTLEYFLAYGVSARRLFLNVLVAAVTLVTIVLTVALGVGVGIFLARGNVLSSTEVEALGFYSIPMTYATACFASIAGMYWSAFSSPRGSMNSPIGFAPLFGVLPPVMVLGVVTIGADSGLLGSATAYVEAAIAAAGVVWVVTLVLLGSVGRLLRTERLLSPV
jgi:hypothetical protein